MQAVIYVSKVSKQVDLLVTQHQQLKMIFREHQDLLQQHSALREQVGVSASQLIQPFNKYRAQAFANN